MKNKYWNNPKAKFPFNTKGGWFIPLIVAAVSAAAGAGVSGAIGVSQQKSAEENAKKQAEAQSGQAYQSASKDGILNYALARTDVSSPEYQSIFEYALGKKVKAPALLDLAKTKISEYEKRTALTPEQVSTNEKAYQAQYDQLVAALKPDTTGQQISQPQIFSQNGNSMTGYIPIIIAGVAALALIMRRK